MYNAVVHNDAHNKIFDLWQCINSRRTIDVGRAGLNRARGYGNLRRRGQNRRMTSQTDADLGTESEAFDNESVEHANINLDLTSGTLHNRRNQSTAIASSSSRRRSPHHNNTANISPLGSPASNTSDGQSIAGLLGLDEEFRIGTRHGGEDQLREVQLRALTRRIMASPCLVLFPGRKTDIDVM
jgi:hypothetical protein